jgi:hypothetical protein
VSFSDVNRDLGGNITPGNPRETEAATEGLTRRLFGIDWTLRRRETFGNELSIGAT